MYLRDHVGNHCWLFGDALSSIPLFTQEEEEKFRALAASPDVIERVAKSIAPSIYGFTNVKRAIACLLFAGEWLTGVWVVLRQSGTRRWPSAFVVSSEFN